MKKTLVVCSGGLDSVTLAYQIAKTQILTALVSFDYGQKHTKELDYAARAATQLGVDHHIIDIRSVGQGLKSALTQTDSIVPEGHYTASSMSATIVPNRNTIMLSIAFGLAESINANAVAIAVHGGDHFIYPDCRPDFIAAFSTMQKLALGENSHIELLSPYLHKTKGQIAQQSAKYHVPIHQTWSCYKGGAVHCGRCGTCVERLEAIAFAGITDKTEYLDTDFWQKAVTDSSL